MEPEAATAIAALNAATGLHWTLSADGAHYITLTAGRFTVHTWVCGGIAQTWRAEVYLSGPVYTHQVCLSNSALGAFEGLRERLQEMRADLDDLLSRATGGEAREVAREKYRRLYGAESTERLKEILLGVRDTKANLLEEVVTQLLEERAQSAL